jgi:hypothetical protein
VAVALVTASSDSGWSAEERAIVEHASDAVDEMQGVNWFQPLVTVALDVDVTAEPDDVEDVDVLMLPCAEGANERDAIAHVDANTLFGATLWSYEVTCSQASLVSSL